MLIRFTEQSYNNLILFLRKTPLVGEEVPAYTEIMNSLATPIAEEENKEKE